MLLSSLMNLRAAPQKACAYLEARVLVVRKSAKPNSGLTELRKEFTRSSMLSFPFPLQQL